MLRRRKKDQRDERRGSVRGGSGRGGSARPPQPATTAPGSRRRARPDAPVPAELKVGSRPVAPEMAPPSPGKKPISPQLTVLVTGFDPFDGERLNPSWMICERLAGKEIAGARIEALKVPCEFRRSIEVVAAAIRKHRPAVVLCLGQAGGRAHLSVERVAINVDDARIADNTGARPVDEPIAANGPPACFATVPIKAMAAAMRAANVPAQVSNSAGTYVCNHVMYGVLHFIAASGLPARAGFIHVPYAEEQVLDKPAMPALSIATMARGVEAAIAAALARTADVRISEGTLD